MASYTVTPTPSAMASHSLTTDDRRDSAVVTTSQGVKRKASEAIDLTGSDETEGEGRGCSAAGSKRMRTMGPTEGATEGVMTGEAKLDEYLASKEYERVNLTNGENVDEFIALMEREVIDLTTDEPATEATPVHESGPIDLSNDSANQAIPTSSITPPTFQPSTTPATPESRPKKTPTPRSKKYTWMGPVSRLDQMMGVEAQTLPTPAPEQDLSGIDPDLVAELQAELTTPEEQAATTTAQELEHQAVEAHVLAHVALPNQSTPMPARKKRKTQEGTADYIAHVESVAAIQQRLFAMQRGEEVGPEPAYVPNPEAGAAIGASRAKPVGKGKRMRED